MIEFPRALARQFRTVVRQSCSSASPRSASLTDVLIKSGTDGLSLRADLGDITVDYHLPGKFDTETLTLPLTALQELEGRTREKVSLEAVGPDAVKARWHEGTVPRTRNFTVSGKMLSSIPLPPERLAPLPTTFLKTLDQARKSTARDGTRYALTRIQLRGARGEVVATDGRQLLVQSGFPLPWREDVLIPALSVFGCRDLGPIDQIRIGRTATHVCLEFGPWTFFLRLDDGRYPRVEEVVPPPDRRATRCRLDAEDAAILARSLSRLVDARDEDRSVTLDLNGGVILRVPPAEDGKSTEVALHRSTVSGPSVRLATDGKYLRRALELGLTDFQITKPGVPVLAHREGVIFVWMPLGQPDTRSASKDAKRGSTSSPAIQPAPDPGRREPQKIRLRLPEPQVVRASAAPSPECPPREVRPRFWGVLRTLFAPRGWLWRHRQRQ